MNEGEKIELPWKYFQLHAGQRISTFHFYIVLTGLTLNATSSAIEKNNTLIALLLSAVIIVISYIFARLDIRTRSLIKHAEEIIKNIENNESYSYPRLFTTSENLTLSKKKWYVLNSYSDGFHAVFWLFGFLGLILLLHILIPYLGLCFMSDMS